MKPGMYIMEAAYPMPSENIAGPFARANGERMRFRRMYAQTKGALRLHRFYSHFPHLREIEFAIVGGQDVVVYARRESDELKRACNLHDFALRVESWRIDA
jgi:hypothetical protein